MDLTPHDQRVINRPCNHFSLAFLLLPFVVLFLLGCGASMPEYKTITVYDPPSSSGGKAGISRCENDKQRCESSSRRAFQDCMRAAEKRAEEDYEEQLEIYEAKFPAWEKEYEEMGCGVTGTTIRQDLCIEKLGSKPARPDLEAKKAMYSLRARNVECSSSNTCTDAYNSCYQRAGGTVSIESKCVKNCGSAEAGPMFQIETNIPSGKGIVYIYRIKRGMSSGRNIEVKANGKDITEICNGCIFPYLVKAGSTQIAFNYGGLFSRDQSLPPLNVLSGKTYYIRLDAGGRELEFQPVPEINARMEMYELKVMNP